MKKIYFFFLYFMFALGMAAQGAASEQTLEISDNTGTFYKNGGAVGENAWSALWKSNEEGLLRLDANANNIKVKNDATAVEWFTGGTRRCTVTLTAKAGKRIKNVVWTITECKDNPKTIKSAGMEDRTINVGTEEQVYTLTPTGNGGVVEFSYESANNDGMIGRLAVTLEDSPETVIRELSEIKPLKTYVIVTSQPETRGAWYVKDGATAVSCTKKTLADPATVEIDKTDKHQQFAFVAMPNGKRYLYSLSAHKFVNKAGQYTSLTDVLQEGSFITLKKSTGGTKAEYPTVICIGASENQLGVSTGWDPPLISHYNDLGDGGNMCKIVEAGDFDYDGELEGVMVSCKPLLANGEEHRPKEQTFVGHRGSITAENIAPQLQPLSEFCTYRENSLQKKSEGIWEAEFVEELPIEPSTPADPKYYWLKIRDTKYLKATDANIACNPEESYDENTQFGFEGNSLDGFKVFNKAYPNKYMHVANWNNGTDATFADEATLFHLFKCTKLFGLGDGDANCLNDFGGNGIMKVWAGGASHLGDTGNQIDPIKVTSFAELFRNKYEATYQPIFAAAWAEKYFTFTQEAYNRLKAAYEANLVDCDEAKLVDFGKEVAKTENYQLPETGYYRIKCDMTGVEAYNSLPVGYLGGEENTPKLYERANAYTIVKVERNGMQMALKVQGKYVLKGKTDFVDEKHYFPIKLGYGFVGFQTPGGNYLHYEAASKAVANWTWEANASHWLMEPVSAFDIRLHEVEGQTYATLCVPFAVQLPEGVKAYVPTYVADRKGLELHEVAEGKVAAQQPVVLIGTTEQATLTILEEEVPATSVENSLTGAIFKEPVNEHRLYLGKPEGGKVGFYYHTGNTHANTAYFGEVVSEAVAAAQRSGIEIPIHITGIEDVEMAVPVAVKVYDVYGKEVKDMLPGQVYIVNGKKVIR